MKKAVFRADASASIGGGHVLRCLTLANTLDRLGWHCTFAVRSDSLDTVPTLSSSNHQLIILDGPLGEEAQDINERAEKCDWLIVDHYERDEVFERQSRSFADHIFVIDDIADRKHDCDILLDQNLGRKRDDYAELVPDKAKLLIGPEYALLRPEFARMRPVALERHLRGGPVRRVLISLGAGNARSITERIMHVVSQIGLEAKIDVLLGNTDPVKSGFVELVDKLNLDAEFHDFQTDIAKLMTDVDIAIGAGGSTSWERCCLGLPTILIVLADNQAEIARALHQQEIAISVGTHSEFSEQALKDHLSMLAAQEQMRLDMSRNGSLVVDGLGATRVAWSMQEALMDETSVPVSLRKFMSDDADWLLALQHRPETRRFSRVQKPPTEKEHMDWLAHKLKNPNVLFMVVCFEGERAGFIRLDYVNKEQAYEISVAVDPAYHQRGIGKKALLLTRELMSETDLIAEVSEENDASRALFAAAGFEAINDRWLISRCAGPHNDQSLSEC